MKRVRPRGSIPTRRRRWTRRLALATALVGSLVGCGTGPGASGGDVTPPSLQLSGVRDGDVRAEAEIAFDVLASDPSAVASVIWSSDHATQGACAQAPGGAYTCGPVPLPAGATTITVRARDTLGNARALAFTVVRDATPPHLSVTDPEDGSTVDTGHVQATVTSSDDLSVPRVSWSTDAAASGGCARSSGDGYACGPVPLVAGRNTLTFSAEDAAGNRSTVDVDVTYVPPEGPDVTPPTLSVSGIVDGATVDTAQVTATVTSADDRSFPTVTWSTDTGHAGDCPWIGADDHACGPIPLAEGETTIAFRAEDGAGNAATVAYAVTYAPPADTDVTPPSLSVSGVLDGETVGDPEIAFEADASDASGIDAVSWSTDHGDGGACGPSGDDAYACGPVPLPPGATTITVEALDAAGNVGTVTVTVHRDVTPPTLTVSGIVDGATVDTDQLSATVTSADERSVPTVTWSTDAGDAGACPRAAADDHECGPIPLVEGDTVIAFRAEDAVGNATTASYLVTYVPGTGGSGFEIELVFFDEAFTTSQRAAFQAAVDRWESLVVGDLQDVPLDLAAGVACGQGEPAYTGTVDDLLIFATSFAEGVGGLLGSAGPCRSRSSGPDAGTNAVGFMRFDTMDLADLEARGDLVETIAHEMGHVLGIGTNWEWGPYDLLDYVASDGASDCRAASGFTVPPTYVGAGGVDAWHDLGGSGGVPVEDGGGLGTRCGHWDEATFGDELMTGYLDAGRANPLSALSVRSLEDIGLTVDASAADPYSPPSGASLNAAGGYDIARAEVLLPSRGTVDPLTGEIENVPDRVR